MTAPLQYDSMFAFGTRFKAERFPFCSKINGLGVPACMKSPGHDGQCEFVPPDNARAIEMCLERLIVMHRDITGYDQQYRHLKRQTTYARSHLYVLDSSNGADDKQMVLYFPVTPDKPVTKDGKTIINAFVRDIREFDDGRFEKRW